MASTTAVAKAIYGPITVLAVLMVMDDHPPAACRGAVTLLGTTLAAALVDTYSETIAGMPAHRRGPSRRERRASWCDVSPVLVGARVPRFAGAAPRPTPG